MTEGYTLYSEEKGLGETIVFLPGILATTLYWKKIMDLLAKDHRVIALDPLGFGRSPKPKRASYTLEQHLNSIEKTLEEKNISGKIILVGHSMGALLAASFATKYPRKMKKLLLISIPIFLSHEEAMHNVHTHTALPTYLIYGEFAHMVCNVFCYMLRPITGFFLPYFMPNIPPEIARDALLHRYHSYARTLMHVIVGQHMQPIIEKLSVPTLLLYGGKDNRIMMDNLSKITEWNPKIEIKILPNATHSLPLEYPEEVVKITRGM